MKKAVSKQLEDVLAIVLFDIYVSSSCKIHAKDFIFSAGTRFKPVTLLKKKSGKVIC